MKTLLKYLSVLTLLVSAASAQTFPTYSFNLSPTTVTATVDKYSTTPIVQIPTPITVTLAQGITTNRIFAVTVPPFVDINGKINSSMFTFTINDGFNNYNGNTAIVYPGGTSKVYLNVDVTKLSATLPEQPLAVPVIVQDLSTGLSQSVLVSLGIIDGRVYVQPLPGARIMPHFAVGNNWRTSFTFTNQNDTNTQLRVEFKDPNGNPIVLRLKDGRVNSIIYVDVFARGLTSITLDETFSPNTILQGTVLVTPTIGFPVGVLATFDELVTKHTVGVPAQVVNTDTLTFPFDATGKNAVGLALSNSLNYAQPLTLTFYDEYGNLLKTTTESLCPGCQIARTLNAAVAPEIQGKRGSIRAAFPPGFKTLNGIAFKFDENFFFIPLPPITNTVQ